MKIGIVTPTLLIGGAERWVLDLAYILSNSQFEYIGIALEKLEGHPKFLQEARQYGAIVGGAQGIQGLIVRADAIIYWSDIDIPPNKQGIFVGHSEYHWTREKAQKASHRGHKLVAVSRKVAAIFPPTYHTTILHNGVRLERLYSTLPKEQLRYSWGVRDDQVIIGYLGRFATEKNLETIAKAAAILGPQYRPVFCGPIYNVRIYQRIMELCPWSIVPGATLNIGNILQAFDYLVCISPSEGFGYSLVEGWGAGIPVISTPVGIEPEMREKYGQLGYSVPQLCKPTDLAEVISKNPSSNPEYIMKAQDVVLSHFTLKQMQTRWINFLKGISTADHLISILTTTWNTPARFLLQLWQSIQRQTWENWEWVIINDGSDSQDTLNALADLSRCAGIKIYHLPHNIGLGGALNFGLNQCHSLWVARIDADDIALPYWLARMMAHFMAHPEVDIVGCQVEIFDDQSAGILNKTRHPYVVTLAEFKNSPNLWCVNHPGVMYRKDFILKLGGYRNFRYAEDVDLWIRALKKGAIIHNVPDILVRYRYHALQKSSSWKHSIILQQLQKEAQEIHV